MTEVVQDKNMVEWANDKEMELSEEIHSALSFSRVSVDKSDKPVVGSIASTLSLLLRARQSCIYPKLMSQRFKSNKYAEYKEAFNCSSKLDYAVSKILERKGNGSGKLIFCHFREEIDEIASRLAAGGITKNSKFRTPRTSATREFLRPMKE